MYIISQSTPKPKKTIIDIDDVVWGLNKRIAERFDIPYGLLTDFYVLQNENLSLDLRQKINQAYSDPETFRDMEFYPGFRDLFDLQRYGAEVILKSNSFNKGVIVEKRRQLLAAVPGLREEQMQLMLVNQHTTTKKAIGPDIFSATDDSPYTIAKSSAQHNIMPRQPWNQTSKAQDMIQAKEVRFFERGNLSELFDIEVKLLQSVS